MISFSKWVENLFEKNQLKIFIKGSYFLTNTYKKWQIQKDF